MFIYNKNVFITYILFQTYFYVFITKQQIWHETCEKNMHTNENIN